MNWYRSPLQLSRLAIVILLSVQVAASQNAAPNPFGIYRGGDSANANPSADRSAKAVGTKVVSSPGQSKSFRPVGTITDPGFAGRLGSTVGIENWPTAPLPPGVSNINHPGMQPMPSMQPLPAGQGNALPSINHPGGTPSMNAPSHDFRKRHRQGFAGQATSGVVFYGVPYFVPYYVYPGDQPSGSESVAPTSSGYSPAAPPSDEELLTLLAFKDFSVVVVIDYWLEGSWLYYVLPSRTRLSVPLDRLDQPRTQQLNLERDVPFILEARR